MGEAKEAVQRQMQVNEMLMEWGKPAPREELQTLQTNKINIQGTGKEMVINTSESRVETRKAADGKSC